MRLKLFLPLAILVILMDRITKEAIKGSMFVGESFPVIHKFFYITHVENTGAAFSIFQGKTWFLIGVPLVLTCGIFIFLARSARKKERVSGFAVTALALIFGGGIGNLIDRVRVGSVTDFLHISFGGAADFPVFNIADIAVCTGCFLLIIYIFISEKKGQKL